MRFNTDFDVAKFNMFMSTLLQAKSADIYRSKVRCWCVVAPESTSLIETAH